MAPLWQPGPERIRASHLTRFTNAIEHREGGTFDGYDALHEWSVANPAAFWSALWDVAGVIGSKGHRTVHDLDRMPGARFFPDGRLNFCENLLRRNDDAIALIAVRETGPERRVTFRELRVAAARAARALRAAGVQPGDRVAGIVPNAAEAVIAALGTAWIGAVWSSCSPDFGADGIVDRFGQIEPKVLIGIDGYTYGGRYFDCLPTLADVRRRLPTVTQTVLIDYAKNCSEEFSRRGSENSSEQFFEGLGRVARRARG